MISDPFCVQSAEEADKEVLVLLKTRPLNSSNLFSLELPALQELRRYNSWPQNMHGGTLR